jgi:hypothetical protein
MMGSGVENSSEQIIRIQAINEHHLPEHTASDKLFTLDMIFKEQDKNDMPEHDFDSKEYEYQHWHTKLGHLNKTRMR